MVDQLLNILELEPAGELLFKGQNLHIGTRNIFGGQVLAQSIIAAYGTVPDQRYIHSLHSYFILPGNPDLPLFFRVDVVRDGGSFSTRRVLVEQNNQTIFIMAASFHKEENGYDHQAEMPSVAYPDELISFDQLKKGILGMLPTAAKRLIEIDFPFEFKPVDLTNPLLPGKYDPVRQMWFKFRKNEELPRQIQEALLAYVSDYNLLATAILPHEAATFSNTIIASIDHGMWFHRPVNINDWLLYDVKSPSAIAARGFANGQIFDIKGKMVASIVQEGLIRPATK